MDSTAKLMAGLLAMIVIGMALSTAAVAEGGTVSASSPSTAQPGDQVSVSFTITNTGNNNSAYALGHSVPSSWTVDDATRNPPTYSEERDEWLWDTIPAGESRSVSVTFQIPNDAATGDYTVTGTGQDQDGEIDSASTTITVQEGTPTDTDTPTPTEEGIPDDIEDDEDTATPTEETATPTDEPETPTPTDEPETPTPTDEPETPTPTDEPETPTETPDEDDGLSTFLIVLILLIIVAVIAGVAYYVIQQQE